VERLPYRAKGLIAFTTAREEIMIVINTEHLGNVHQRKKNTYCAFFSLFFFLFPFFGDEQPACPASQGAQHWLFGSGLRDSSWRCFSGELAYILYISIL